MTSRTRTLVTRSIMIATLLGLSAYGVYWLLRPPPLPVIPGRHPRQNASSDRTNLVSRPARPRGGYVGSAVCRDCHQEICDEYHSHPMEHATAYVEDAPRIEDFTERTGFPMPRSPNRGFDVKYYVSDEAGIVHHHERATAPDGSLIYELSVPIHIEVGSGRRGRSYITNQDGVLLMSPMTWYSQSSRWDLSPGYEVNNLHFERRVLLACIHCHAGRVAEVEGEINSFDANQPVIEGGISCERCHGPGEGHVAFRSDDTADSALDTIVNPSRLEPHLRDSVCLQCHLIGEERIPRYGRTDSDFRPGDDVADIWAIFVRGDRVGENQTTEAVSQSEQMLSSQCYQQSDGRLGCASCHDPHSSPAPDQRQEFYRSRCMSCHDAGDPPCSQPVDERLAASEFDSCIDCHMPGLAANDVPHTSQTDHRVLRVPHAAGEGGKGSVVRIFREESGVIPEEELNRARAIFRVMHAERTSNPAFALEAVEPLRHWLESAPDDLPAIEALGVVLLMGREVDAAFDTWQRGLELAPQHEDLLKRLMFACHDNEQFELGIEYGLRVVKINPAHPDYWGRLAHMLGQQGRLEEAIEAAERAIELRPYSTGIHTWLVDACRLAGDDERAAEHQRMVDFLSAKE